MHHHFGDVKVNINKVKKAGISATSLMLKAMIMPL